MPDKIPEKWVGTHRAGFEFRMKLTAQKPGMVRQFDNLYQSTIRREST